MPLEGKLYIFVHTILLHYLYQNQLYLCDRVPLPRAVVFLCWEMIVSASVEQSFVYSYKGLLFDSSGRGETPHCAFTQARAVIAL